MKGRASSGSIQDLLDRGVRHCGPTGAAAWLYVVFGCSTAQQQLYVASDWACMPWTRSRKPDPSKLEDWAFSELIPDTRSHRRHELDAEGTRSLAMEVVTEKFELVWETR